MNRREFINKSAAVLALSTLVGQQACADSAAKGNKGRIGIQLYSVKDELPKDFMGTLKKIAAMGYAEVEPYGFKGDKFLNHTMKEFKAIVNDLGMTISSVHSGSGIFPEDTNAKEWDFWKKVSTELKSGGGKWAVQAGYPGAKTLDDLKKIGEHFNRIGEVCKKSAGIKFAYHNHDAELKKLDNEVILEYLIKNTDPKLVNFQLDLGHVVNGNGSPDACIQLLRNYPKRIAMWHASDFDATNRNYTDVGKGSVPYPALFELAASSGLQVLTVEQETDGDIFASCKVDFDYLKQFKWTKV